MTEHHPFKMRGKGECMAKRAPFSKVLDNFAFYLKSDSGLYKGYQSNIAMAFYDAVLEAGINFPQLRDLADKSAKDFLDMLIKRGKFETTKNKAIGKRSKKSH